MSRKRISDFKHILVALANIGVTFRTAIDGGAGMGITALKMAEHMTEDAVIYAFEPFPGNHRFFGNLDDRRIVLIKKALAETGKKMNFSVLSTLADGAPWRHVKDAGGYSSVGRLMAEQREGELNIEVDCVRADEEIHPQTQIDFVKLDLQGGELNALRGMSGIIDTVKLFWIEFSNQPGLLDFLEDLDLIIFDTEYMFIGTTHGRAPDLFVPGAGVNKLSTGHEAWKGFRRKPWNDIRAEFDILKKGSPRLIQTDLACVSPRFLDTLLLALSSPGAKL